MNKSKEDLLSMQKKYYDGFNKEEDFKEKVVGHYDSHEQYPYEKYMLYENIDESKPIFTNFNEKIALDFGCGIGRMVKRMNKIFLRVDGVDIGTNLIDYCKQNIPESNFWVTSGDNCSDAPLNTYDFAFSTICLQHIPSYDVRRSIFKSIHSCLKDGGKYSFQLYSVKDYDDAIKFRNTMSKLYGGDFPFARWFENHYDAEKTNSGHDVIIFEEDYDSIIEDMKQIFSTCNILSENSSGLYNKVYIFGNK